MGRFGKNTRMLLYGITVICVLSFLAAFGISTLLAKNFQTELMVHDYGVAGYLLNNEDEMSISAFTAKKSNNDIANGRKVLTSIGYDEATSLELLPIVVSYRDKTMFSLFLLVLLAFGAIYFFVAIYLQKQCKDMANAERSIHEFLNGNTMSRIESEETGDWYSLFHEINELASILSAHAENEKQTKEFLQDIISDVSHQIKTPLSALKMYQEIMDSRSTDAKAVSSFSKKSLREIKRMEDVIYTLLKLARLDAGIIQLQKAPENLSVLIQDILERFEVWAKRENKTITLSGKENVFLSCDALWISEAVGNIVKNALEHTVGIANVFSNTLGFLRQRKREFAQYMSVGMTPEGMRKMFCIEALVIAGRPLLITLPLTVLSVGFMITASYLNPMEFLVKAPIVPIVMFILAIFGFVSLAYYIGGKRMLNCNLADALRNDSAA